MGPEFYPPLRLCASAEKPIDIIDTFKSRIAAAGFANIHEKVYNVPLGDWAKNPGLKEAGKFCKAQVLAGIEGVSHLHGPPMFLSRPVSSTVSRKSGLTRM